MKIKTKNHKPIFDIIKQEGVEFLQFKALNECDSIIHGFSTRLGGISEGIYSSMNLSFTRGDKSENVIENYKRMGDALGVTYESFTGAVQTHTIHVREITIEDQGSGISKPNRYEDVDGMITNASGITLTTYYADCVPLYFVDPVHKAIGLSHSGWKGTVNKMGQATIDAMRQAYETNPKDLITAIGPSICQECYEVSEDVIEQFKKAFSKEQWNELFYKKENGKYQLDLWKANEYILLEAGVKPEHITTTNLCTCCNPDILFSHRASKGKRGNLAAFLAIK